MTNEKSMRISLEVDSDDVHMLASFGCDDDTFYDLGLLFACIANAADSHLRPGSIIEGMEDAAQTQLGKELSKLGDADAKDDRRD